MHSAGNSTLKFPETSLTVPFLGNIRSDQGTALRMLRTLCYSSNDSDPELHCLMHSPSTHSILKLTGAEPFKDPIK